MFSRILAFTVLWITCCGYRLHASDELGSDASRERPNVLFIAVDDLACTLGCYGDVIAQTPHIDRLAASGVCFQNAYNQLPLCNPTRASIMTGLRPDKIKVYDLDRHFRDELPDVVTLSQAFRSEGYFAARVGKIYHYNVPASIGTDGFDDPPSWDQTVNPIGRDKTDESLVYNAEPHRKISGALSWLAAEGGDEEQTDGMIATEAIALMQQKRDEPFFLAVGFFRPHTPYVAPQKYFDLYPPSSLRLPYSPPGDRNDIPLAAFAHNCPVPNYNLDHDTLIKATQAYYACVSFVDAQVGRLLDSLQQLDLAENTIVVLWSDHGYHLGEHDGVWQKRTLFEQSARAPLIIRSPQHRESAGVCRRIVEFVDIYPTLTDLAGIAAPENLDGRSLSPLLDNPLAEWDNVAVTQVLRPADDRLGDPVMGCSIRTDRYRYTEWGEGKYGFELYDHHADPLEFNNLAIDPDELTRNVIAELQPLLRSRASGQTPTTPFNPERL
ncbi:iduronate-2-sulfatase [Rhodopirellula maiorica SM1]|uniref:Iduronate-2-sulfatase n=1 Tax=Rhodopirellula maiorica SM1 TaxID=1265738 RepID=M5RXL7_9BACT|nr:sulfatase [Rhodopirellula maiorica]EMI18679.1 iduronate-2-sulfatase [Rhodopirellula maiorica SM1]